MAYMRVYVWYASATNQGPEALRLLIATSVSAWNSNEDGTDSALFISRHQWEALGVHNLSYNSTVKVPTRYLKPRHGIEREIGVYWYLFSNHYTRKCIHKK